MPLVLTSPEEIGVPDARWTSLCGFSGCKVFLVEENGHRFVRKIAKDKAYNDRLIQQKEKQENFQDGKNGFFTAAVLREGHMPSGLYYFDMDYLRGESAAHALESLSLSRVQMWSDSFLSFCPLETHDFIPAPIFRDKVTSLKASLASSSAHTLIDEAMARLDKAEWAGIPQSSCHGDLTLENIVVSETQFHLIDFLDSFAESWFIDAAKLMQDLYGQWSFRHSSVSHNTHLRLLALRDSVEAGWMARHKDCLPVIKDIYILHLLRIFPYCATPKQKETVETMLSDALRRQ